MLCLCLHLLPSQHSPVCTEVKEDFERQTYQNSERDGGGERVKIRVITVIKHMLIYLLIIFTDNKPDFAAVPAVFLYLALPHSNQIEKHNEIWFCFSVIYAPLPHGYSKFHPWILWHSWINIVQCQAIMSSSAVIYFESRVSVISQQPTQYNCSERRFRTDLLLH